MTGGGPVHNPDWEPDDSENRTNQDQVRNLQIVYKKNKRDYNKGADTVSVP